LSFRRIFLPLLFAGFVATSVTAQPSESPYKIHTAVFFVDVRDIDGARQSFTADIFIRLRWKDQKLASDQDVRFIPLNAAWHPNVQVVNRITVQTTLPEGLEVDRHGNVLYRQRYIGQFSCQMDLREFPFDTQEFPIRLVSLGNTSDKLQFVPDEEGVIVSQRFSMTDWKILSGKKQSEAYDVPGGLKLAGYNASFQAKRYFLFFLVQIIIPIGLIVGMSSIAFWLDRSQTGPRSSISITSMLTIVAYRLLLGNFIPRLSYLTRLDFFVFMCTSLVFLSLLNVVFISRLMMKQKEALAIKMDTHSRWIFPLLFLTIMFVSFFK
jgi:hypothetical protein